jgi:hypothetical protein
MTKRKQSEQVLAERAAKKADTSSDSFRNRLFARFGRLINTKADTLPSAIKGLASLVLRTFVKLKFGEDKRLNERTRVVTVGLRTVLHDNSQTESIVKKLKDASDYMSMCRVNAALLANYIFLKLYRTNSSFPQRDKKFYCDCLTICGGGRSGNEEMRAHFATFSAETGILALQPKPGIDQVRGYEAERMATAASIFIQVHFDDRRNSIMKWHLGRNLKRNGMTVQRYKDRVHQLCNFITSEIQDTEDVMMATSAKLLSLGFHVEDMDLIEQMVSLVTELPEDGELRLLMTLQELYLTADRRAYEEICSQAFTQFPNDKMARSAHIQKHWQHDTPPKCMAALPFCSAGATFITVDKKAMQQLCKMKFDEGDIWWYKLFMNPFKKKAKISCLRLKSGRVAENETDLLAAMQDNNNSLIPWLIGPTFQTDGRQIKLQLLTAEIGHPGAPGLMNLHKEGYQVSFGDTSLENVTTLNKGVYSLRHIHTDSGLQAFDDTTVIPVDPGDAVVVEGAHFPGLAVRRENVMNLMDSTQFDRVTFSGAEYREKCLATYNESAETRRRVGTPYGAALNALQQERKRTCSPAEFVSYCLTWNNVSDVIWSELLTDHRRGNRFERFRAVQKTIEEIAERVAPKAQGESKRVVMFEDGKFKYNSFFLQRSIILTPFLLIYS